MCSKTGYLLGPKTYFDLMIKNDTIIDENQTINIGYYKTHVPWIPDLTKFSYNAWSIVNLSDEHGWIFSDNYVDTQVLDLNHEEYVIRGDRIVLNSLHLKNAIINDIQVSYIRVGDTVSKFENVTFYGSYIIEASCGIDSYKIFTENVICYDNKFYINSYPLYTNLIHDKLYGVNLSTMNELDAEGDLIMRNVILPHDISNWNVKRLNAHVVECPTVLPAYILCVDNKLFNLNYGVDDVDISGIDLATLDISNTSSWQNIRGFAQTCPQEDIEKTKCLMTPEGAVLLTSNTNYNFVTQFLQDYDSVIDVTNVDLYRSSFLPQHRLPFKGKLFRCPQTNPDGYECINDYMVGPYVDLTDAFLTSFVIGKDVQLSMIRGKLDSCPDFHKSKSMYMCSEETKNTVLGPYVKIDPDVIGDIPLLLSKNLQLRLDYARINDIMAVPVTTNKRVCSTFGEYIEGTCNV